MSAPGLTIDVLTAPDIEAADELLRVAFGSPHSFRTDLERYMALQRDGWFRATSGGELIGTVGAIDYGGFAYIGLMAVKPAMQSRGIGRRLMVHLLDWLERRGTTVSLLDATDAGRPLYASLGFMEHDEGCVYLRQSAASPETAELPPVRPARAEDLTAIAALDRPLFGVDRAAVLRTHFEDFPGRFLVTQDATGQISGYACAQSRRIGPWAAQGPGEAEALLRAALSFPYEGAPQVIVPKVNGAAATLLKRYGFTMLRRTTHMRRGGEAHPIRRERLHGQASFAIG